MNSGAILVGLALLVLVVAYVSRPLFARPAGGSDGRVISPRVQLTARRDALYALIRELDADYQTGKVDDQDYRIQRERYVGAGVSLLKQLDALDSQDGRAVLKAEIEAAVLALRQARPTPGVARRGSAPSYCTRCGHPADREDNFCGRCGAPLKETAGQ